MKIKKSLKYPTLKRILYNWSSYEQYYQNKKLYEIIYLMLIEKILLNYIKINSVFLLLLIISNNNNICKIMKE